MTRVPTTATYNLYMSQMSKQKAAMTDISYQAATGNRYDSYDKYGLSTYRLLSLQNERAVTNKYLETNSITQVVLEAQQTSVDGIRSALTDVRSQVREFFANDLAAMSENPTEEELLALQNVQEAAFEAMSLIAYYLNTQVDGNYVFGGGKTTTPPVDFPYTTLEEFQAVYDGDVLTYPNSYSASLSQMSTSADVLGGVTIKQEFQTLDPKVVVYHGSPANEMTFDSATNSLSADPDTFLGIQPGDQVIVQGTGGNDQTLTVQSVSEDGSMLTFAETVADETITDSSAVSITKGSWVFSSTEDLTTGITTNALTGRPGSFSDLKEGEKLLINGTGSNNGYLTIKEISDDGSTITFEENVVNETIGVEKLTDGTVNIQQSTQTGTITAEKNVGIVIETIDCPQSLTVNTADNTITGAAGTFSNLKGGQTVTITDSAGNEYALYVKSVSPDGSTLDISTGTPVPDTNLTNVPLVVRTHSDIGGFVTSSMKGSALQTGDIGFSVNQNAMTATVKGAFSSYKTGDCLIIKGADGNDKMYIIDSVSEDGRTVKFSDETPVEEEMSLLNGNTIADGAGVTICKTYSVGATVEMGGTNGAYNGLYTVLGVSADGKELIVRTEDFPEYGATESFTSARFETSTYYNGGQLSSSYRVSETTTIVNDINASSAAFEKVFRALGAIAQGNMLDPDNIDSATQRVSEALDLLDEALTANSKETNGDVTSVQYAVISKLDLVKTTIDNQTALQNSLETYISSLTQVDKTEAATMLLQAAENLKVSYSVLSTINSLSLLNYL